MITFTLPWPPSANRYWRVYRGYVAVSSEARVYKRDAAREALRQGVQPLAGRVGVRLFVYRPQRSGDLDNRFKVALDALNGVAWHDDEQIVEVHGYRREDPSNPRIDVAVWSVAPGHVQESLL